MHHGLDALWLTLDYLWVHFLVVLVVAGMATGADAVVLRGAAAGIGAPLGARAISNLGCASLGFAIAFFVAQGIPPPPTGPTTMPVTNSALTGLATGLTTLITAGLALFENRDNPTAAVLRTGTASFLLTAILSYKILELQTTYYFT